MKNYRSYERGSHHFEYWIRNKFFFDNWFLIKPFGSVKCQFKAIIFITMKRTFLSGIRLFECIQYWSCIFITCNIESIWNFLLLYAVKSKVIWTFQIKKLFSRVFFNCKFNWWFQDKYAASKNIKNEQKVIKVWFIS